jgi:hypothetical protein
MKTLGQIDQKLDGIAARTEARIAIGPDTTPGDVGAYYVISAPGSYYLTANVTANVARTSIRIDSGDVTVDLNGYAVIGGSVYASYGQNVVVRNGFVRDGSVTVLGPDVVVQNVNVTGGSITGNGTEPGLVENCKVRRGRIEFSQKSVLRGCTLVDVDVGYSGAGISGGRIESCSVSQVKTSDSNAAMVTGISGESVGQCVVTNCSGPTSIGISARLVEGCTVNGVSGSSGITSAIGIRANLVRDSVVSGVYGPSAGMVIGIESSRVETCSVQSIQNSGSGVALGIRASQMHFSGGTVETARINDCIVQYVKSSGILVVGEGHVTGNKVAYCETGINLSYGTMSGNTTNNCQMGYRMSFRGVATGNISIDDTQSFDFAATGWTGGAGGRRRRF